MDYHVHKLQEKAKKIDHHKIIKMVREAKKKCLEIQSYITTTVEVLEDESIQIEDERIEEDIKHIMRMIQRKLQDISTQWKIITIQMKNQRREAMSKFEKVNNEARKVMAMLKKVMDPMSEAIRKQLEVQIREKKKKLFLEYLYQRQEVHVALTVQHWFKESEITQHMNGIEKLELLILGYRIHCNLLIAQDYPALCKKVQQYIKSKQQEIRSILDKVKKKLQIPETVIGLKVLCWNINGSSKPRNCLVPAVLELILPDVLLLQENFSGEIFKHSRFKNYGKVVARGPKGTTESLVLYNKEKFENVNEELGLKEKINGSIEKIVPNTDLELKEKNQNGEEVPVTMRDIYKHRMSYVALQIRGNPESPKIIFISFHNIYKVKDCYVRETARLFCKLVLKIQRQTGCVVVAGADLNHQLSTRFCSLELGATLIPYEVTERRSEKRKIDYFIIAPEDTAREASVEALNFIDTEESDLLHSLMSNPIMKPGSDEPCTYDEDDYKEALDHDPLLCELK